MFLHYDMDCFFASIEMRDNPNLKNVPIVVGTHVVATANYVARKYGVHSAQSVKEAKKLCNNLIVVNSRTDYYFSIGRKIQNMIKKYFKKAVFLSCDEGYIEFESENIEKFANNFKKMIVNEFNLPLSIGVGFNRVVAKIASEVNKPNGIYILDTKAKFIDYAYDKKINIFPGIGNKTFDILYKRGIIYTKDVYAISKKELALAIGQKASMHLLEMVRGNILDEKIFLKEKSISREQTFYPHLESDMLFKELDKLCDEIKIEIMKKKKYPLTITLKIKDVEYNIYTRSKTFNSPISENSDILGILKEIYFNTKFLGKIRLIGVGISNFSNIKYEYLKLFKE